MKKLSLFLISCTVLNTINTMQNNWLHNNQLELDNNQIAEMRLSTFYLRTVDALSPDYSIQEMLPELREIHNLLSERVKDITASTLTILQNLNNGRINRNAALNAIRDHMQTSLPYDTMVSNQINRLDRLINPPAPRHNQVIMNRRNLFN